jgi:hypothetical protein
MTVKARKNTYGSYQSLPWGTSRELCYKKSLPWGVVPQELFCMAKIMYSRATGVVSFNLVGI